MNEQPRHHEAVSPDIGRRFTPVAGDGGPFPWLWIGTWGLGGEGFGWQRGADSRAVLQTALAAGVRYFDTAGFYGHGKSEAALAAAIRGHRQRVFIATKGGLWWNGRRVFHDASPTALARALSESLERLRTDYVDLFQLHWPDPEIPLQTSLKALAELAARGLTRCFGVCNLNAAQVRQLLTVGGEIPHQVHFNPIHRHTRSILEAGNQGRRCANCAVSPLEQGLIAGKSPAELGKRDVRRRNVLFREPAALKWVHQLQQLAALAGVSPVVATLMWIVAEPGVSAVIAGPRTPSQLVACLAVGSKIAALTPMKGIDRHGLRQAIAADLGPDLWKHLEIGPGTAVAPSAFLDGSAPPCPSVISAKP